MRTAIVGFFLAVVGIGLLAHPLFAFPHHGQASVFVHQFDELESSPSSGEVVAYADLHPDAQRALDAARDGESYLLWHGDDEAAIAALEGGRYVERDGTYYEYDTAHRGGVVVGIGTSIRVLLTGLGSLALVVGLLVARTESFRPLTSRRALAVPVVATVGVVATNYYDVTFSGASAGFCYPAEAFGPIALLGVALVVAFRRGDRRAIAGLCGVGGVASLAAFGAGASIWLAAFVAIPLVVPALGVGGLLAEPAES